jgi:ubiquinone/menaquinone biosynthesis C-methylase UbiE
MVAETSRPLRASARAIAAGGRHVDRADRRVLGLSVASIDANRRYWNQISHAYQEEHDPQIGAAPRLWGMFSFPDRELHALGDVTGKRVLELGCGAGQWSRSLAAEGATVVGLDPSDAQLAAAAQAMGTARYPLVQAAAQRLPFAPACFDVVFCDHGGLSWAPPHLVVSEAARVLRQAGRLVFTVTSPWFSACYDDAAGTVTARLQHSYFGPEAITEEHGAASYQLTYGAWIKTLLGAGLVIEDLIEPRPAPGARNGYTQMDPPDWAHHWPAEMLWVARKA